METTLSRVDDLLLSRHDGPWKRLQDRSKVAIFHEGRTYSYHDLYRGMMKVAARLCEYHLWSGERVIVHLGNRPEAIMAIMGCSYMGCTFVPVADTIKGHRLAEIIEDCDATAIITDEKHEGVLDQLGDTNLQFAFNIDEIPPFDDFVNRSKPAYPAALMYTSGTTGKPKGVICPQHKIMAAVSSINAYLMHTSDDIVATALPLSHGYGLYQVLTLLEAGGSVLLEPNFSFPQQTLIRMRQLGVTGFAAVPSMIHMLMQVDDWDEYLDGLTYITTAGAALPPATYYALRTNLLTTDVIQMYGQTECVRALYYPANLQAPADMLRAPEFIRIGTGVPIPDTEIKLVDDGVPYVKEGEMWIKSPHVMDGYWNNPDATIEHFQERGWLSTGDRFRKDETGMFHYIGRMDELVKIKGERCSPQELDNALLEIETVQEAACFAVEDKLWGNRFVACVVVNDDTTTERDILKYCKQYLEHYLLPKRVVIMHDLPRNENGKVVRNVLKDFWTSQMEKYQ